MATLTIRDFDDELKRRLRMQAASRNRSMEEEARQILRAALSSPQPSGQDLVSRIRLRFADAGPVDLPTVDRELGREPPTFDETLPRPTKRSKTRITGSE